MARELADIVRTQLAMREEYDRLSVLANNPSSTDEIRPSTVIDLAAVQLNPDQIIYADELDRFVDRFREDENITDAWLANENAWREKLSALLTTLAKLDQSEAKAIERVNGLEGYNGRLEGEIRQLKDDNGRLEDEIGKKDALLSGLANENEWLRFGLNHRNFDS